MARLMAQRTQRHAKDRGETRFEQQGDIATRTYTRLGRWRSGHAAAACVYLFLLASTPPCQAFRAPVPLIQGRASSSHFARGMSSTSRYLRSEARSRSRLQTGPQADGLAMSVGKDKKLPPAGLREQEALPYPEFTYDPIAGILGPK